MNMYEWIWTLDFNKLIEPNLQQNITSIINIMIDMLTWSTDWIEHFGRKLVNIKII